MTTLLTVFVVAMSVGAADAHTQHESHQMPGIAAPAASNAACAQGGMKALAIVEAASTRLETARRANSAADLQRTMSELQRAVGAAQGELFTCRAAVPTASAGATLPDATTGTDQSKMNMGKAGPGTKPAAPGAKAAAPMAGMDHSKTDMDKPGPGGKPAAPGAKAAAPMAGMDHSKMNMGKPAAGAKSAAPGAKPAAPEPIAPIAGMDHSKMATAVVPPKTGHDVASEPREPKLPVTMAERIADPACRDNVGQATAPKAVYERKVYYFCSAKARDEFRKGPAAYLKKHPR